MPKKPLKIKIENSNNSEKIEDAFEFLAAKILEEVKQKNEKKSKIQSD